MNDSNLEIITMNGEASLLLSELHSSAFRKTLKNTWSEKVFRELFSVNDTQCYIIKRDALPLGFGLIRKVAGEAEIITFCILPNECKNGYATILLEWIIKDLQHQSIKRLFLEVKENNEAALELYKKCSFDIIGRRNGYYQNQYGDNIDAIVMQRELFDD